MPRSTRGASAPTSARGARDPRGVEPQLGKSVLTVDGKSFPFPPLSPAAQELIVAGGAEKLVASRLRAKT
jgi:hypothetical protein